MTPKLNETDLQVYRTLKACGYFERADFNPNPVWQAVASAKKMSLGDPQLSLEVDAFIARMKDAGLLFSYTSEPDVHPKDVLDQWRLGIPENRREFPY